MGFAHHREVASLPPAKQSEFLQRASDEIESKKGAWLDANYPNGGNRGNQFKEVAESNTSTLADIGITRDESANARKVSRNPELVQKVIEDINIKKVLYPVY